MFLLKSFSLTKSDDFSHLIPLYPISHFFQNEYFFYDIFYNKLYGIVLNFKIDLNTFTLRKHVILVSHS